MKFSFFTSLMCLLSLVHAQEQTSLKTQPIELGKINWHRNFEKAKKLAKEQKNPFS